MHWPSKGVESPVAVGWGVGALAHHWYHLHAQPFIVYKAGAHPQVSESAQPRRVHKCAHCTDREAEARGTKQPGVEPGLPPGSAAPWRWAQPGQDSPSAPCPWTPPPTGRFGPPWRKLLAAEECQWERWAPRGEGRVPA